MKKINAVWGMGTAVGTCVVMMWGAAAQAAPPVLPMDAGRSLHELQVMPAPSAKPIVPAPFVIPELPDEGSVPDVSLFISQITMTGNETIATDSLRPLVDGLQNREVTLAELRAATHRITALYRDAGYLVARAYLPEQHVENGEVVIAVLEGVLSGVEVHNSSRVSDRQVNGMLQRNIRVDEPLKITDANRAVLLLQTLPGVETAHGGLQPGAELGSTALAINTTPAPRVNGLLRVDNYGNKHTGRHRLTGLLNLPSVFGLGDELSIQGVISEDDGVDYARLAWDAPVGYRGLRLGAAASHTTYELGKDYKALDAYGDAVTLSLYGSYPLVLAPSQRLNIGLSLEQRQLNDKIDRLDNSSKKQAQAAVLTLDGDRHDGFLWGGANAFRFSATVGDLSLDSRDARLADDFLNTEGSYNKFTLSVTRLQQLPANFSVFIGGDVQFASKNLDSSEAMFLGGAQGVRAYPQGEGSGDEGWMINAELRYNVLAGLQAKVFYDEGEVTISKKPSQGAGANHYRIGGTGVGVDAVWRQLHAGVAAAWRSTGRPLADKDDAPRVWGQVSYRF